MSCRRSAEGKFWSNPELVERLLVGFLDSPSIVNLAQAHTLALQTLQKPLVWKAVTGKLLDPSQDGWKKEDIGWKWKTEDGRGERAFFDFHRDKMEVLVSIVELVNSDGIKIYLVDIICDRFSASDEDYDTGEPFIRMSFSSLLPHQHHNVSDLGFFLLEELKLGEVEEIDTFGEFRKEELLLALHRRVSSQQGMVSSLSMNYVDVGTAEGAEAFSALAKRCKTVEVGLLNVVGDIGSRGWSALGETMETWGGDKCTLKIKLGEGEAKKESWEALMKTAHVWGRSGCSMKLDPTVEWEDSD